MAQPELVYQSFSEMACGVIHIPLAILSPLATPWGSTLDRVGKHNPHTGWKMGWKEELMFDKNTVTTKAVENS